MSDPCPVCGVGRLTLTRRTYVHLYGQTLIQAPNVPAWMCDACRLVIFDQDAVGRIDLMVGEAGPPPNTATPSMRPAEAPPADAHPREDRPDDPPPPAKP